MGKLLGIATKEGGTIGYEETCIGLLQTCAKSKALIVGRQIHAQLLRKKLMISVSLWNTVINMYAKCGSIEDAREVFNRTPLRNAYIWTTIITGYAQHGDGRGALLLYELMKQECIRPDNVTFVTVVSTCTVLSALEEGKRVHSDILKNGSESYVPLGNAVLDMYTKCGSINDVCCLFSRLSLHDVVSWSIIISAYAEYGKGKEVFQCLEQMQHENVKPNRVTFLAALSVCMPISILKWIHGSILKALCASDAILGNSLVDTYAKCGSVVDACIVFDRLSTQDVISWTAIIAGCHSCNRIGAVRIFWQMQQARVEPNELTFLSVLCACCDMLAMEQGKLIHAMLCQKVRSWDIHVSNTLLDFYAKCASIEDACSVFNGMIRTNAVSWSVMIAGYTQCGSGKDALELFRQMQLEDVQEDKAIFLSALRACTDAAHQWGRWLHACSICKHFDMDLLVGNAFVDMYAKSGLLEDASHVFSRLLERDVVSWSTMITGYMQHGNARETIKLFAKMQEAGFKPEEAAFTSLLSACSHSCLVDEGCHYLGLLTDYNVRPLDKHFTCMIDLLGRAGYLVEAQDFLSGFPYEQSVEVLTSCLSACRLYGGIEIAKHVSKLL